MIGGTRWRVDEKKVAWNKARDRGTEGGDAGRQTRGLTEQQENELRGGLSHRRVGPRTLPGTPPTCVTSSLVPATTVRARAAAISCSPRHTCFVRDSGSSPSPSPSPSLPSAAAGDARFTTTRFSRPTTAVAAENRLARATRRWAFCTWRCTTCAWRAAGDGGGATAAVGGGATAAPGGGACDRRRAASGARTAAPPPSLQRKDNTAAGLKLVKLNGM